MSNQRTTKAFENLPNGKDDLGIGYRPGSANPGHNRLKGNRNQASKHKMRSHYGMVKPKSED